MTMYPSGGIQYIKLLFEGDDSVKELREKLIDFYPGVVYIYDTSQQKLSFINKRVTDMLGYSIDDIKQLDNDFLKLIFNEDVDAVKAHLTSFDNTPDNDFEFDCRFNHKGGDWRYFRSKGITLNKNEAGKTASMLFIAEDITDKFKSDEEIRVMRQIINENEQLLQFGNWVWDIKADKLSWSEGLYNMAGYTREELKDSLSCEFVREHASLASNDQLSDVVKKAITEKSRFHTQLSFKAKDDTNIIVSAIGTPVVNSDGTVDKVVGTARNITDQIIFEETLLSFKQTQLDRERFMGYGSWEANTDFSNFIASDGMLLLYGYDPAKRGDHKIDEDFFLQHAIAEDAEKAALLNRENTEADYFITAHTIVTASGEEKKLENFSKIVRNEGKPAKIYGITRDVTRLKEYERSLENKIKELNRSNKELEEFAYVASHDLQEPLRKLMTFSERLVSKYGNDLGADVKMYVDRIVAASENMRILIENLLEFSRVTRAAEQYRQVDLNEVLKDVYSDLEIRIAESNADINTTTLPTIEAVASQMKQLFLNLISNSIKFHKKDDNLSIFITSQKASEEDVVTHLLTPGIPYHKITVEDNGIGFEQEYSEKIFQIFQRLHGKVEYPGSGVGLAICKKIVENHNGVIFAEGNPARGATFTIILPEYK